MLRFRFVAKFPWYTWPGLAIILISEIGLFLKIYFFRQFMTPLCWTGLISFLDGLNFALSGKSLIQTRRREFWLMLPVSIAFWYVFEFYNLFIKNWHYIGLPESRTIRYFGYFWSFATIWPGVLQIDELLQNLKVLNSVKVPRLKLQGKILLFSFGFGLLCLVLPFLVPYSVAKYLAAPVWMGFVFLLDPLNYSWGRASLWGDWQRGKMERLFRLFLAGAVAGVLWEFWNYWALGKWIYTVPILGDVKIFEMPVVGYLGFLPFAVEIFVMWESAKYVFEKLGWLKSN